MQNLRTIAVMSALLGGMATFIVSTSRSPQIELARNWQSPAQFLSLDARPIYDARPTERPTRDGIELAAHSLTPAVVATAPVLLAQASAPGSAAENPKIIGIHTADPATSANLIDNANPNTNKTKVFVKIEFPNNDDEVPKGVLTIRLGKSGSVREARIEIAAKSKKTQLLPFDVTALEMKQAEEVVALWDPEKEGDKEQISLPSDPLKLWIDNVPPRILSVQTVGETGGVAVLEIQLANNDLKKGTLVAANFVIHRTGGQHDFATEHASFTILDRAPDSFVVRLNLGSLISDLYQIEVKPAVTDQHDNPLVEPRKFTFNSFSEAATGAHVPFPEFVRRKDQQDEHNPADRVETRVARLYYIRDAHRVAQIINRNVKSYNQAGVNRAQLNAKNSRETAEQSTRSRQLKEREAIRTAESNRQLERELVGARQELEQMRSVMSQRDQRTNQSKQKENNVAVDAIQRTVADKSAELEGVQKNLKALVVQIAAQQQVSDESELVIQELQYKAEHPTPGMSVDDKQKLSDSKKVAEDQKAIADAKLSTLKARKEALSKQLTDARSALQAAQTSLAQAEQPSPLNLSSNPAERVLAAVRTAASKVAELERAVADKRQIENDKREQTDQAQELEDRARENQFRAEVAAGTEDPDTYVPGDVKSEDPVAQVSISVIGEGLLQLRGPIRGINKIRSMINQIDSPLGQVKIGIFTVQVNGEHGDRMEKVTGRIEGHIDLSRFLTNQSLGYLRRAIQEVAGAVVANVDAQFPNQHRQIDRDRKYLYAFFGRDFIDELYEMDSEFLRTENKLLSLHGMDTVSQSQACFIMALSKNDIRQQILDRFRCLIEYELPQAEWDYRRTSSLLPCKLNSQKEVVRNAFEKYKFRNVHGFFEASVYGPDTMTPMQREFIRLAQIFKSQMGAEMELKQRVVERLLIEDASNDERKRADILKEVRQKALEEVRLANEYFVQSQKPIAEVGDSLAKVTALINKHSQYANDAVQISQNVTSAVESARDNQARKKRLAEEISAFQQLMNSAEDKDISKAFQNQGPVLANLKELKDLVSTVDESQLLRPLTKRRIKSTWEAILTTPPTAPGFTAALQNAQNVQKEISKDVSFARGVRKLLAAFREDVDDPSTPFKKTEQDYLDLAAEWDDYPTGLPAYLLTVRELCEKAFGLIRARELKLRHADFLTKRVRVDLDHRKLLDFLIEQQEEKLMELVDGTRSHLAQIDTYLKRLAIALEDDFKVQFYDPAFAGVRAASREWDVNLGQVERTTILTNNRQFAKVSPQATMEFDLPKRAPMIVEGMNGARALVQEYGTLLQDPTFLSLSGMMSGGPVSAVAGGAGSPVPGLPNQGLRTASVRTVLPGQSTDTSEQLMSQTGGPDRKFGAALEALIPDPAVYKFETGTGFEIRPVIQPDGHSVIYDFDYMYTTNVREPVRPDEKHLGRVKRHLIHTQVQTSSFELREISRYQVALKASRTSRGVPLLEDIPGAGVLFRPLPSDESSLQQNIILGQSTVYPTLFDLMGLRWSKYVVDLDHIALRDLEHVTRGREEAIHDFTFDEASKRVDEFLDIQGKHSEHMRPDLYHQQRSTSPNHPGGYQYQPKAPASDPRNRGFTVPDRRPEEYRAPAYDGLRRNPIDNELRQIPTPGGQPEDMDLRLMPPEEVPLQGSSSRSNQRTSEPNKTPKTSGLVPKAKPSVVTIQPATYEEEQAIPKAVSGKAGHARADVPAVESKPPTVQKKKSWVGSLKTPFKK